MAKLKTAEIEKIIDELDQKNAEKLQRFTLMEIERMGYAPDIIRRGSEKWDFARDTVINNIYGGGQTLDEIEEREE